MYDVSVTTIMASSLPQQTMFSYSMEIPGTMFYLNKKTMYKPGSRDRARASKVLSVCSSYAQSYAGLANWLVWVAYRTCD
jgi:hypothetical protein